MCLQCIYIARNEKEPFQEQRSLFSCSALTVCPLKFFGDHYLEFLMAQYFGSREKK